MKKEEIYQFLYFGYVLNFEEASAIDFIFNQFDKTEYNLSGDSLIEKGIYVFQKSVEDNIIPSAHHVVPLSGGLDSRAILGALLGAGIKNKITAITFGTPGTWDFEIGCRIAKKMRLNHEVLDLTKVPITQKDLLQTANDSNSRIRVFNPFYDGLIRKKFGKDPLYWSGYMGGPLAGSHLPNPESQSWQEAIQQFCEENRMVRSIDLAPPDFQPNNALPKQPWLPPDVLTFDEQLDFKIRQQMCIPYILLTTGYRNISPFLHPEWVNFILRVPNEYRRGQYLYKKILLKAYPKLFSFPAKNNLGLPLNVPKWRMSLKRARLRLQSFGRKYLSRLPWGVLPWINYIDFDRGLLEREDLKTVVYENLQDLKRRQVVDWIDIDGIWKRHQARQGNYADALTLLASLEINLKVKGQKK